MCGCAFPCLPPLAASVAVLAALVAAPTQGAPADRRADGRENPAAERALADARALFDAGGRPDPATRRWSCTGCPSRRTTCPAPTASLAGRGCSPGPPTAADPDGSGYQYPGPRSTACTAELCVHWVESTSDKVSAADDGRQRTPDYVETVAATVDDVLDHLLRAPATARPSPTRSGR